MIDEAKGISDQYFSEYDKSLKESLSFIPMVTIISILFTRSSICLFALFYLFIYLSLLLFILGI